VPVISAGLLLYRRRGGAAVEVLLVHPGGPFWRRKDLGAWTIPKGEVGAGEALLAAARREFQEETGFAIDAPAMPLGHVRLASGKIVHAFAAEGDVDASNISSNTFELEWPRGSGERHSYPEVDRAAWFGIVEAGRRILPAQAPLLDYLTRLLKNPDAEAGL
jgi:predicted NUDIX family NTP pyrophosphohydrolase